MVARAGIVLAVLQLAFGLTWVVYVAYLPALAAQVGLAASVEAEPYGPRMNLRPESLNWSTRAAAVSGFDASSW